MRLIFEADYFDGHLDLRSEIYNALSDIAFEFSNKGFSIDELEEAFNEGIEWFQSRFWEDEDLDESLIEARKSSKDVDLREVEGTIAYVLNHNSSVKAELEEVMNSLMYGDIDWKQARKQSIQIIEEMPGVTEETKQKAIKDLMIIQDRGRSQTSTHALAGMLGTYFTGKPVL